MKTNAPPSPRRERTLERQLRDQAPDTPPVSPEQHEAFMAAIRREAAGRPDRTPVFLPVVRVALAAAAAVAVMTGVGLRMGSGEDRHPPVVRPAALPEPGLLLLDWEAVDFESASSGLLAAEWTHLKGDLDAARSLLDRCFRQYNQSGS